MSAQPEQQRETIPAELRAHWRGYLTHRLMLIAANVNLVPVGETDIAKLPPHVHPVALRLRDDLITRSCRAEMLLGSRRPRIARNAEAELWGALRPFAQRGHFYVEHLVGDAATQREARIRLAGDGP